MKGTDRCKVCGHKINKKAKSCCTSCWKDAMPFAKSDDYERNKLKGNFDISSSNIDSSDSTENLMNQLNKLNSEEEIENETIINCKYMSIDDLNSLELNQNNKSFLHLNISSLPYHIDELRTVLSQCKSPFDVIGITESRIRKDKTLYTDISLDGYSHEHQPTESSAGGVLIYLSNDINYKCRDDLNIYKSKELESIFIETLSTNCENFIIGCIYKHPKMSIAEYNEFLSKFSTGETFTREKRNYNYGRF